jgi:hypothetical protein
MMNRPMFNKKMSKDTARGIASVPRFTKLLGQPHMLAYINPEEEKIIQRYRGNAPVVRGPGNIPSYLFGFTSFTDMFDGGGAGGSGDSFFAGSHDDYVASGGTGGVAHTSNDDDDVYQGPNIDGSSGYTVTTGSNSGYSTDDQGYVVDDPNTVATTTSGATTSDAGTTLTTSDGYTTTLEQQQETSAANEPDPYEGYGSLEALRAAVAERRRQEKAAEEAARAAARQRAQEAAAERRRQEALRLEKEQADLAALQAQQDAIAAFSQQVAGNLQGFTPANYDGPVAQNPAFQNPELLRQLGTGNNFRPTPQQLSAMLGISEEEAASYLNLDGLQYDFRNFAEILGSDNPLQALKDATFAMYLTPDLFGQAATGVFANTPEGFNLVDAQNYLYSTDPSMNPDYTAPLTIEEVIAENTVATTPTNVVTQTDTGTPATNEPAPIRSGQPTREDLLPVTTGLVPGGGVIDAYTPYSPITPTRDGGIVSLTRDPYENYGLG